MESKQKMDFVSMVKITGGTVIGLSAIFVALFWVADFVRIPKTVYAMQEDIVDLKQIMQYYGIQDGYEPPQQYRNQRQQAPPYQPPPRDCWDEYYKEWYVCDDY